MLLAPRAAYAALFLVVAAESAGLPVPGETSLIAAAVATARGYLSLPLVIVAAAAGAIVGDNVGYALGRFGVRSLFARPGRWAEARARLLRRGERLFERHGGKAVFLGRWLPGVRVTVAWLAGANALRWRRFAFWNALGGIAWATSVAVVVRLLGEAAASRLGLAGLAVLAALLLVFIGARALRRRRARSGGRGRGDGPARRPRPHPPRPPHSAASRRRPGSPPADT